MMMMMMIDGWVGVEGSVQLWDLFFNVISLLKNKRGLVDLL
jgi:hypothetical protein